MNKRYDLFQSISQRKDRTLSEEDARLVSIANDIIRATGNCRKDEAKSGSGIGNVVELNEREGHQGRVPLTSATQVRDPLYYNIFIRRQASSKVSADGVFTPDADILTYVSHYFCYNIWKYRKKVVPLRR